MSNETPHDAAASELRRKAEALLMQAQEPLPGAQPGGSERLLHELQVHQIELELQNEELARAYEDAASLRDKYRELYDFAPIGYFTLAADGSILQLNLRGAQMLGGRRSDLVGRRFLDFLQPESLSSFAQFLSETMMGLEEESVTLVLDGREPIYVKLQGRLADEPGREPQVRLAMMDVTAVKFANDELQRSFEKFFTYWRP